MLTMLLNLDQFGAASGLGPQPKYWAIGIFLVTLILSLPGLRSDKLLRSPLTWWASAYFVFSSLWMLPAGDLESALDGLMMVITTCLFVVTALLVFPVVSKDEPLWGATLWLALLAAAASVVIEFSVPGFYVFSEAGQGITGRAAGLFLNPNAAAQAILMILACLLTRRNRWASVAAALLALPALLLTFSRGGLIGWLVLVTVSASRGQMPRGSLAVLAALGAGVMAGGSMLVDAASGWFGPEYQNSLNRLTWILGQSSLNGYASNEREWVAAFSWHEFIASPLVGYGLGYTWVWSAGIGPHNMILRHLVEYGALGFLIFPLFLSSSIWSANPPETRRSLWPIAAVIIILSFFSHNMLEQGSFVFSWLALCLMRPSTTRTIQY